MQNTEIQMVPLAQYQELEQKYDLLRFELAQLKRLIFGVKSERFIPLEPLPGQLQLALGLEAVAAPGEVKKEVVTYERNKKQAVKITPHGRSPLPASLPRQEVVLEPEEDTTGMKHIGDEITEELEYKPGKLFVRHFIRPKYARPETAAEQPPGAASSSAAVEQEEAQAQQQMPAAAIVIAPLPVRPIEKGIPGAGLLTHLLVSKIVDHLPLYRQMKMFERAEVKIAASTLGDWFRAACNLLVPLYDAQKRMVLGSSYLQMDETPIKVLESEKKGKTHRGYLWVCYAPVERLALFEYDVGRSAALPKNLLSGFRGDLQTDGYSVYEQFGSVQGIRLCACMAHARREFERALEYDGERAGHAMSFIQALYTVERRARDEALDDAGRLALRQTHSRPLFDQLGEYLREQLPQAPPKSPITKAISYSLSRWDKLGRFLEDGKLEIDDNLVENAIRPVAIGRKNYLFAGNHEAAQRLAMLYSLMAACKMAQLNPAVWLRDVFFRIPNHPVNRVAELLPNLWKPLDAYPDWWTDIDWV